MFLIRISPICILHSQPELICQQLQFCLFGLLALRGNSFPICRDKFAGLDAQVVDISVDSIPSKIAWQKKEIGLMHTPMCADFYPHGEVSERFGILRKEQPFPGICERAVFIVDKMGKIAFARIYPLDQAPNNEELLAALKKIGGAD